MAADRSLLMVLRCGPYSGQMLRIWLKPPRRLAQAQAGRALLPACTRHGNRRAQESRQAAVTVDASEAG